MARIFTLSSPFGDKLKFDSMSVDEGLGRLFELTLVGTSEHGDLKSDDVLGKSVTVTMAVPERPVRHFNGYCVRVQRGQVRGEFFIYTLHLRPWLWFLTRTSDCKIFQKKTVPEILKEVFADEPTQSVDERLSGNFQAWDYCVQYRETDFDFVSRLMEQEGIYYYFEHSAGGHKAVLCDSKTAHLPMAGARIPFVGLGSGTRTQHEFITNWSEDREVQSGMVTIDDYDPVRPGADLRASRRPERAAQSAGSQYELYTWPGEHDSSGEGDSYAAARAEALYTQAESFRGGGIAYGLMAGRKFTLTAHPHAEFNREYLATDVYMHFSEPELASAGGEGTAIDASFRAIQGRQQYRPVRSTPKPTIQGIQTAEVVGPGGEEIYTDELGRVKVQFRWDRYGRKDDKSSCWIRVATPWASSNFGAISLPRIGNEVVVTFLEGDPDRPLITGAVYNGDNKPPYSLPANKTQSGVKTKTEHGGASSFNELRFEDKQGDELLFIQAQKDYQVMVKNDFIQHVKRDCHFTVERDAFVHVDRRLHIKANSDMMTKMDGAISLQGQEMMVGSRSHLNAEADQEVHVKGGMSVTVEAGVNLTLKVGGNFVSINPAGVFIQGTMVMINSGGAAGAGTGVRTKSPTKAATNRTGSDIASRPPRPPRPPLQGSSAASLSASARSGAPYASAT